MEPEQGGTGAAAPSAGGRAAEAPSPAAARHDSADSSLPGASRSWAVADSLQTFAALFEAMADAVFIFDQHGALAYTNAAAASLLGQGERAAPAQGADAITAPEPREQLPAPLRAIVRRLLDGETLSGATALDVTLMAHDEGEARVNVTGAPLCDRAGRIVGAVTICRDVSERRRLERMALDRAAQLETIIDVITDGILVYDRDNNLLYANAAARATNPWLDQRDYQAQPLYERAWRAVLRDAAGHTLPREAWPVARVLRGEVLTGPDAVDILMRGPDGADVLLNVSAAPIRDAQGQISGGVIVDRDMTERYRLERRTREALDALLEMAQAMVLPPEMERTDDDAHVVGRRLVALARDVLGCARISIVAVEPSTGVQHALAVVGLTAEQERAWRAGIEGLPLGDSQRGGDFGDVARFMAGEVIVVDMNAPPYRDRPNPFGILTVLVAPLRVQRDVIGLLTYDYGGAEHDYTPEEMALAGAVAQLAALTIERDRLMRERAEARGSALALEEANRRMDAFLGVASHELRTPLTGIRGSLQLMQRRLDRAAGGADVDAADLAAHLGRVAPLVGRALQQTTVLGELVDDLVDVARIQAGELYLRPTPCDLAALLRETVEEQRELAPERAIHLEAPAQPEAWVEADVARIEQVVRNYLSNALKYSTEEQAVTAGITLDRETARLWVRDEGPGVAPADQERIWDRFSRVVGTSHRSGSSVGLGIGLYICRVIVERHGGQVGVESIQGQGATFWFTLPLSGTKREEQSS